MARGKKKLTLDEQLAKVTAEIEATETTLTELKATKKELESQILLEKAEAERLKKTRRK